MAWLQQLEWAVVGVEHWWAVVLVLVVLLQWMVQWEVLVLWAVLALWDIPVPRELYELGDVVDAQAKLDCWTVVVQWALVDGPVLLV